MFIYCINNALLCLTLSILMMNSENVRVTCALLVPQYKAKVKKKILKNSCSCVVFTTVVPVVFSLLKFILSLSCCSLFFKVLHIMRLALFKNGKATCIYCMRKLSIYAFKLKPLNYRCCIFVSLLDIQKWQPS